MRLEADSFIEVARAPSNASKLSDRGWRGKTWNAGESPPPAAVRWSAWLGDRVWTVPSVECGVQNDQDCRSASAKIKRLNAVAEHLLRVGDTVDGVEDVPEAEDSGGKEDEEGAKRQEEKAGEVAGNSPELALEAEQKSRHRRAIEEDEEQLRPSPDETPEVVAVHVVGACRSPNEESSATGRAKTSAEEQSKPYRPACSLERVVRPSGRRCRR